MLIIFTFTTHAQHRRTKEIKNEEFDLLAESPCACRIFDVDYDISVYLGRYNEDYVDDHDDDHDGGGFGDDDEECDDGCRDDVELTIITSVNTKAVSKPMPTCVNVTIIKSLYPQKPEKDF